MSQPNKKKSGDAIGRDVIPGVTLHSIERDSNTFFWTNEYWTQKKERHPGLIIVVKVRYRGGW